eukprot:ANDGO_07127.mRNA.1 Alpha-mannosidase I MNS4
MRRRSLLVAIVLMVMGLEYRIGCHGMDTSGVFADAERIHYRDHVKGMFDHAFSSYMTHAFPQDELRPLTCSGRNTWGPYALTLVDAMDTLAIMGNRTEFERAVRWVIENARFDRDITVSVFETNIRILGGLLSSHFFAFEYEESKLEWYQGELLSLAVDLGRRLLPAFETPTGIPFGMVNLQTGVNPGESKVTSTAGAGTFLLEFGILSRLTGDPVFEQAARNASNALFRYRSSIGLVGNHISVVDGTWTLRDAGIGAGVDSFLEYLAKSYLLFGDVDSIEKFVVLEKPINAYLKRGPWYFDVNMDTGGVSWPLYNSLQGFWPGLLASLGRVPEAQETMKAFHGVWRQFGSVPEGFNVLTGSVQAGQSGYPLRPELMESAYHLYRATKDPLYLMMGRDYVESLDYVSRVPCGYANVLDVQNRQLDDRMESFFLSETLKYLYLLFDTENPMHQRWMILNTEGHPFPVQTNNMDDNVRRGSLKNASGHPAPFSCPVRESLADLSRCGLDLVAIDRQTDSYKT